CRTARGAGAWPHRLGTAFARHETGPLRRGWQPRAVLSPPDGRGKATTEGGAGPRSWPCPSRLASAACELRGTGGACCRDVRRHRAHLICTERDNHGTDPLARDARVAALGDAHLAAQP